MQAFWGPKGMTVNGAEVTNSLSVAQATEYGAPLRYGLQYAVKMWIDGTSAADLSAKEDAFRAALEKQSQDFVLKDDTGKPTSSKILVSDTASGTRVVGISAPEAQGGEYVNRRTLEFVIQAEYHVKNAATAIVSWQETLTFTGDGGPREIWRFPVNRNFNGGKGIRQEISPCSLIRAVQAGRAVGYLKKPKAPVPIFPLYFKHDLPVAAYAAPQSMGVGFDPINYAIDWSYTFERGDGPLVGLPKLPPGVI